MIDPAVYIAPNLGRPGEVVITPWSFQSLGVPLYGMSIVNPSSQSYVAANVGVFVPFTIPEATTFTKMWWANGSAVAGNFDAGIFAEDGTRLVSIGSTAQAGTSALQIVDITDTTLYRGRYYMGITADTGGATQTVLGVVPAAGILQAIGLLEDSSCAPPMSTNANPATFVAYSRAFLPYFGVQGYRTLGP